MYETIRIVKKIKPSYVIWENVKNVLSKKHKHNFDNYINAMESMGYRNYYQVLNAKDYGIPQNRERVFTISIRNDIEKEFVFPEKQELKLKLKDMLEPQVDEKYYLSDKLIKCFSSNGTGNYPRGERFRQNLERKNQDIANSIITTEGNKPTCNFIKSLYIKNNTKLGYQRANDGDSVNLQQPNSTTRRARVGKQIANTIQTSNTMGVVVENERNLKQQLCNTLIEQGIVSGGEIINHSYTNSGQRNTLDKFIESDNGILPTLTTRPDTLGYVELKSKNKRLETLANNTDFKRGEVLNLDTYNQTTNKNISQCLTEPNHNNQAIYDGLRIRKLTPKECWRLMGFNDEEFSKAEKVNSNAQLYKQAGNSIVVNVLESIFKNLFKERTNENSNTDVMQKQEEQPTSDMEHENTQTDDYAEQIILTI